MKNGKYTDSYGHQFWYKDGKYHREDGPAIILSYERQYWYKDGNLHREDGPAVIYSNGSKAWYKDGKHITNDIIIWANDRNIDLNNLSDYDKIILKMEIKMWK
jgi:hypothetical protein